MFALIAVLVCLALIIAGFRAAYRESAVIRSDVAAAKADVVAEVDKLAGQGKTAVPVAPDSAKVP